MNFNDVGIASIKGNDYRIHFWYMNKDEAISIMHNSSLNAKNWILIKFFQLYIQDDWNNLLSKTRRSDFKQSKRLL